MLLSFFPDAVHYYQERKIEKLRSDSLSPRIISTKSERSVGRLLNKYDICLLGKNVLIPNEGSLSQVTYIYAKKPDIVEELSKRGGFDRESGSGSWYMHDPLGQNGAVFRVARHKNLSTIMFELQRIFRSFGNAGSERRSSSRRKKYRT
jgi:hypothetical protein